MKYIIIDAITSNCATGFESEDAAMEFIKEHSEEYTILTANNYKEEIEKEDYKLKLIVAPMEYVDSEEDAELSISPNTEDCYLDEVATFTDDLLTSDILDSIDVPVKCYME